MQMNYCNVAGGSKDLISGLVLRTGVPYCSKIGLTERHLISPKTWVKLHFVSLRNNFLKNPGNYR